MLQKSKKLGILRPSLRYLYNEIRVIFFILHHAHFVVDLAVFFMFQNYKKYICCFLELVYQRRIQNPVKHLN